MENSKTLFSCNVLSALQLNSGHLARIQNLFEKCEDFFILVSGKPSEPNAANDLLMEIPPETKLENKYVIGFIDKNSNLVGLLDAMNGYPKPGIWFIGLLLFVPDERRKGYGEMVMKGFKKWILSLGAVEVRLGVVEQNKQAIRFWEKMGFTLLEIRPPKIFGLKELSVFVYRCKLT
jgi:RimJ/RimL family protein N-acetyltransferase